MLRHAAACVAVTSIAIAGCGGGSKAQPTGPSNKAGGALDVSAVDDVLAFLPVDSDIVIGIDAVALRSSALYQQFEPQIIAGMGDKLAKVREQCGFDPMKTIERAVVGGKVDENEKFIGVIVVRGVSGPKVLECIAETSKNEGTVTTEGGTVTVDRGEGEKTALTIVASNTLVMQFGPTVSAASLDAVIQGGVPLRGSQAFMGLFNRRESGSSVWGMINGNAPFMAEMAQAGARPKSIDGTLIVKDRFVGALRMTFATPDDANKVNQQMQQILPMVQGQFDKVDVRTDGAMIRADVIATDEQLKKLFGAFGAF